MSNEILNKLQAKKMYFLHEHLQAAIVRGEVLKKYKIPAKKHPEESHNEFAQRLALEASKYQFVAVQMHDQVKYVSFGVPGPVITSYGDFFVIPAEVVGGIWGIHYFLFSPSLESLLQQKLITLRIDSGCFSGMVLGDITCDCLHQLREAQKLCARKGGIVIEIPGHDGRGWGEYKMANQKLMNDLAYDTIKAAELFYGDKSSIDSRTYSEATIILKALGFSSHKFDLATKNPFKVQAFLEAGFNVASSKPVKPKIGNKQAMKNINAKRKYWKELTNAQNKL
jgi:GTP cyclohydrolase II